MVTRALSQKAEHALTEVNICQNEKARRNMYVLQQSVVIFLLICYYVY